MDFVLGQDCVVVEDQGRMSVAAIKRRIEWRQDICESEIKKWKKNC
jgi:hypothetical protein